MKTRILLASGVAIALGLAVAGWLMFKQTSPPEIAQVNIAPDAASEPQRIPLPPAKSPAPAPGAVAPEPIGNSSDSAKVDPAPKVAPQSTAPRKPKEPSQDPLARDALCLVGVDPEAEDYWIGAINDARLSGHERQDLIEDLNEEGFADPKNLTIADLPVILRRIQLIEELAPDAMDKVNADAFAEAYKDLVNMYGKLLPR